MKILAIETSCDETAICILEATETAHGVDFSVLGNITHSQIDIHQEYGGVFPALAKREHIKNLPIVLEQVLSALPPLPRGGVGAADGGVPNIDVICVTSGPGLEPALWTGIVFAKELGEKWNVPVVPVNHMEGHILSTIVPEENPLLLGGVAAGRGGIFSHKIESLQFPALALLVSGGHTELVLVNGIGDYKIIGKTRDDAVGEAFDKVARILGLPYPGGPEISRLAAEFKRESPPMIGGVPDGIEGGVVFPRPMIHSGDYDFSFSGLKTAVLYFTQKQGELSHKMKCAIAHEFQEAAIETLVSKTKKAVSEFGIQTLIVGGGVAANSFLRETLNEALSQELEIKFPTRELSTDNAVMIALAGYFKIKKSPDAVYNDIKADGNWSL